MTFRTAFLVWYWMSAPALLASQWAGIFGYEAEAWRLGVIGVIISVAVVFILSSVAVVQDFLNTIRR